MAVQGGQEADGHGDQPGDPDQEGGQREVSSSVSSQSTSSQTDMKVTFDCVSQSEKPRGLVGCASDTKRGRKKRKSLLIQRTLSFRPDVLPGPSSHPDRSSDRSPDWRLALGPLLTRLSRPSASPGSTTSTATRLERETAGRTLQKPSQ